jgi:FkbM family methyltransferase
MASHFSAYVKRFGFGQGAALYARTKLSRGTIEVTVPGTTEPLIMRGGSSDRSVFNQVFVKGEYELLYPGTPRFIIDAGANVGYASLRFAQQYPGVQIVAVEPDEDKCALARRNLAAFPNVRCLQSGVWTHECRLAIENPNDKPWAFKVREAKDDEASFPAVSVESLLRESPNGVIDIFKIDVEGTERELFLDRHCDTWLSRTNMIFIELHDRFKPGCEAAMQNALARHEFTRSQLGENVVLIRKQLLVS